MVGTNKQLSMSIMKQVEKEHKLQQSRRYATLALCNCTVTNCFREKIINVVTNKWFDNFILVIILMNCVTLSLESTKEEDKDTNMMKVIRILDLVYLGIFTLEMVLKIIA